jgi:PsbP-like protein
MNGLSLRQRLIHLLFLSLLVGCTTNSALPEVTASFRQSDTPRVTGEWETYTDQGSRYTVAYPADWIIAPSEGSADVIHFVNLSTSNSSNRSAVTVIVQGPAFNLRAIADNARQTIQEQNGVIGLQVIQERGIEVNGIRGIDQVLTYTIAEQPITHRIVYLQHPQHTFAFSLTAESALVNNYTVIYEEMLRSFLATP